jgi:hypothetical protein
MRVIGRCAVNQNTVRGRLVREPGPQNEEIQINALCRKTRINRQSRLPERPIQGRLQGMAPHCLAP